MEKSILELFEGLKNNPMYLEQFSNASDVFTEFCIPATENIQICYAEYDYRNYEGYAMVIFFDKEQNKYFEVYGSHCSCFGLENQWNPEEVNFSALNLRIEQGHFYDCGLPLKRICEEYIKS